MNFSEAQDASVAIVIPQVPEKSYKDEEAQPVKSIDSVMFSRQIP